MSAPIISTDKEQIIGHHSLEIEWTHFEYSQCIVLHSTVDWQSIEDYPREDVSIWKVVFHPNWMPSTCDWVDLLTIRNRCNGWKSLEISNIRWSFCSGRYSRDVSSYICTMYGEFCFSWISKPSPIRCRSFDVDMRRSVRWICWRRTPNSTMIRFVSFWRKKYRIEKRIRYNSANVPWFWSEISRKDSDRILCRSIHLIENDVFFFSISNEKIRRKKSLCFYWR